MREHLIVRDPGQVSGRFNQHICSYNQNHTLNMQRHSHNMLVFDHITQSECDFGRAGVCIHIQTGSQEVLKEVPS